MRDLLRKLQEPAALKSSELQPLQWLFGRSGDMGLSEGTRKTSIVFISKIMFVHRRVVG